MAYPAWQLVIRLKHFFKVGLLFGRYEVLFFCVPHPRYCLFCVCCLELVERYLTLNQVYFVDCFVSRFINLPHYSPRTHALNPNSGT